MGVRRIAGFGVVALAAVFAWQVAAESLPAPVREGPVILGVDRFHGNRAHREGGPSETALSVAGARGFRVGAIKQRYTPVELRDFEVVLLGDSYAGVDATPDEAQALARWVHAGGVFIANPLVWVAEAYGKKAAADVNVNVLMRPMGVFASPKYLTSDVRIPGVAMREYDMILGANTFARDPMLEGVSTLGLNGLPGQMEIQHGDVLVWSTDGGEARQPLLVRVPYGAGYVIAYQHESLFGDDTLAGKNMPGGRSYDNLRLWENLLDFVHGHRRPKP